MQASSEESKVTSSLEFSQQFSCKMKLHDLDFSQMEKPQMYDEEVQLDVEEEEEEEEFTFACLGSDESQISADDAFHNGQVQPTFPLFDQSLVFGGDLAPPAREDLARRPPVKKVFIEAEESTSTRAAGEEIEDLEGENPVAGMYCTWSGKAVEASPEICKKSNSTGFSKIWRFRELTNRSNSDGRDAFVFLNNSDGKTTTCSKREEKGEGEVKATSETTTCSKREEKGIKAKKGKKGETTPLSAHELHYVRNRALREGDKRRSYLPYKPDLVGFFTNVNGGLSRNVHPF